MIFFIIFIDVLSYRAKFGVSLSLKIKTIHKPVDTNNKEAESDEYDDGNDPYHKLFSDSEDDEDTDDDGTEQNGHEDMDQAQLEHERLVFLDRAKKRQSMDSNSME